MSVGERFIVSLLLNTRRNYPSTILTQERIFGHFQKDLRYERLLLLLTLSKFDWNLRGSIILTFFQQEFFIETAPRYLVMAKDVMCFFLGILDFLVEVRRVVTDNHPFLMAHIGSSQNFILFDGF